MDCILYARYSPRPDTPQNRRNGQRQKLESNDTQLEYCRAYARERGYEIRAEFADAEKSGANLDRPGIWDALNSIRRGEVLVVYTQDRLSREPYELEYLRRETAAKGATIEYVKGLPSDNDPMSEMVRGVFAQFDRYTRVLGSMRTRYAMLRHQRRGRRMSGKTRLPYGWALDPADDTMMVRVPAEQDAIDKIMAWHRQGLGNRQICHELEKMGVPSRGKRWHHESVKRIIRRELQAGD